MIKRPTHDLICNALKSKKAYQKLVQYFEHPDFNPSLFDKTNNDEDDYGNISFLRSLISHINHSLSTDETIKILNLAIKYGASLFEHVDSDINFTGTTTFELALRYQDLEFIKHLVEHTSWKEHLHDLNFQPIKDIFVFAAMQAENDVLEYLATKVKLEQIHAESERYGNALMAAVMIGNYDNVLYLHQNFNLNTDINLEGMNLLMYATQSDDDKILSYLINHIDFDLEGVNADGEDILLCAVQNENSIACYQYLMANYADRLDINKSNYYNEDLVYLAQQTENWEVFSDLLNNSLFNFNKTYYEDSGFNILMLISPKAPVDVVDELLKKIPFNVQFETQCIKENDNKTTNAFLEAAEGKNHELLQYYLEKGYFIDLENLNRAKEGINVLYCTQEKDGSCLVQKEKEQQKKCLDVIMPYMTIALEKEQLEHNVLNINDKKQTIKNKI